MDFEEKVGELISEHLRGYSHQTPKEHFRLCMNMVGNLLGLAVGFSVRVSEEFARGGHAESLSNADLKEMLRPALEALLSDSALEKMRAMAVNDMKHEIYKKK